MRLLRVRLLLQRLDGQDDGEAAGAGHHFISSIKMYISFLFLFKKNNFLFLKDILTLGYQTLVLKESADSLTMQNSPPGSVLWTIYHEVKLKKYILFFIWEKMHKL